VSSIIPGRGGAKTYSLFQNCSGNGQSPLKAISVFFKLPPPKVAFAEGRGVVEGVGLASPFALL